MAKKIYALFPEERTKECDHPSGFAYRGEMPCTGPRVCHLCGTHAIERDEVFEARTPERVFELVTAHEGRPTAEGLRRWVNTVLGPWSIPSEVSARCRRAA